MTANKALVINCNRNGLAVVRSLGAHGVPVIAADHFHHAAGLYSRYAEAAELVPFITDGENRFVDTMLDIARRHGEGKPIVMIPTHDAHLLTFVKHWERLQDYYLPTFPTDSDVLLPCVDKILMCELAEKSNVPYPKTRVSPPVGSRSNGLSLPVIVKPNIRTSAKAMSAGVFRLRVCSTRAEVEEAAADLERRDFPFLVQEIVPGGDDSLFTAGVFAAEGDSMLSFTGRKVRQFPPNYGECAFGETVCNPRITQYAKRLLEAAGFTGIAQVEFKHHNGEYYLIEINPRSWSWVGLAVQAGVDLPWAAYRYALSGHRERHVQQRERRTWSYFSVDWSADKQRSRPIGKLSILRQSLAADVHAVWRLRDPLPAIAESTHKLGLRVPKWLLRIARLAQIKLSAPDE